MHSNFIFLLLAIVSCLVSGRTVQWTAAGGNPLWDTPNNWDSLTVPTINDDVIINVANIPGNVRIGSGTAYCHSLTVGGNSGTTQSLIIYTGFVIGDGGASIASNGLVTLLAAPTTPLSTSGVFNGYSKFVFISGALAGTGSFVFDYVAFNQTSLKVINASTTVNGILDLQPITGPSSINIASNTLLVKGTFNTAATGTLSVSKGALLDVQGTFLYAGSQTDTYTVLGDVSISTFTVSSGTVIINDNATVAAGTIAAGATVTVIGSQLSVRKFGQLSGNGILNMQGGLNYVALFDTFGTVEISGGTLIVNGKASSINTLVTTGGFIQGGAAISISTATLTNAQIDSTPIAASVLNIQGYSTITGSSMTVTASAVVVTDSQFTLNNGAQFIVSPHSLVTQSANFQILPSSGAKPQFTNNGQWTSSKSDLKVMVPTTGNGLFQFGLGATMEVTGVSFATGQLTLISANFTALSATCLIGSISGNGTIIADGQSMVVSGSFFANMVILENGFLSAGTTNINNFDLKLGTFNITGGTASLSALHFEGGSIGGGVGGTVLSVGTLAVDGTQPKTLDDIYVVFTTLNLDCNAPQCQLFTTRAKLYSATYNKKT